MVAGEQVCQAAGWAARMPFVPWKETCIVDQRFEFIAAVKADPRGNFTRLCERFGISRPTGYALLARYRERGLEGLENRLPRAQECPHRTEAKVEDLVVAMRKKHSDEGPKKLVERLAIAHPGVRWPAPSTIGEILKRRGLIRPRRARLRVPMYPSPLEPCAEPNDVWCTDFKGHFQLGDRSRCHPLTITDGASRYLICCEALTAERTELARPHFERAFAEFGLPARIRSDNGPPFATKSVGGLSALSVWWIQHGIVPERIEPGQPQQNGRHERFHRTLKERTTKPPAQTMAEQQRAFDYFRRDYNDARPHEALGQKPPASMYEPSWRAFRPARAPEYGEGFDVRRVNHTGVISFRGNLLFVSQLLTGQPVGLRSIDDDEWEMHYGPLLIGHVLIRKGHARIEPPA
jgi:putative transposase